MYQNVVDVGFRPITCTILLDYVMGLQWKLIHSIIMLVKMPRSTLRIYDSTNGTWNSNTLLRVFGTCSVHTGAAHRLQLLIHAFVVLDFANYHDVEGISNRSIAVKVILPFLS